MRAPKYFLLLASTAVLLGLHLNSESIASGVALLCLLAAMMAVALFVRTIRKNGKRVSAIEVAWSVFAIVLLIATVASGGLLGGQETDRQLRLLAALFVYSAWIYYLPSILVRRVDVAAFIRAFDVLGVLISVSVFLPFVGPGVGELQVSLGGFSRSFGPFGDGVAFAITLFCCRAFVAKRWLELAVHLAALSATAGVGAALTLVVAVVFHIVLPWRSTASPSNWKTVAYGLAMAPVLLIGVVVASDRFTARLLSPTMTEFTVASRLGTFQAAAGLAAEYPWLGVGFNGFGFFAPGLREAPSLIDDFGRSAISKAANQNLQTLTDGGVIGLVAFLVVVICAYRSFSRSVKRAGVEPEAFRAYQVWFIGLVIGNQTAVWLLPFSIISFVLFVVIGLSIAAERIAPTVAKT